MNEQDKELLFIDLCGRVPYGVKCSHPYGIGKLESIAKEEHGIDVTFETPDDNYYSIDDCKPYLFPLSSMTEEQCYDFYCRFIENEVDYYDFKEFYFENNEWHKLLTSIDDCDKMVDWFNKNHFDYRGLISKELAIDATDKNIY